MHVRRRVFLPARAMDGYKLQTGYKPTTNFVVVKMPVEVRKTCFGLQNYKKFPIIPYARVRAHAHARLPARFSIYFFYSSNDIFCSFVVFTRFPYSHRCFFDYKVCSSFVVRL